MHTPRKQAQEGCLLLCDDRRFCFQSLELKGYRWRRSSRAGLQRREFDGAAAPRCPRTRGGIAASPGHHDPAPLGRMHAARARLRQILERRAVHIAKEVINMMSCHYYRGAHNEELQPFLPSLGPGKRR